MLFVTRVGTVVCGLPIEHVIETMRPLPIVPVAGAADFIAGLAVVRGSPIPVVHLAVVLGVAVTPGTRFVIVRCGQRRVALIVDAVLEIRAVEPAGLAAMPALLGGANREVTRAIGVLDRELLVVLDTARLVPDAAWRALEAVP